MLQLKPLQRGFTPTPACGSKNSAGEDLGREDPRGTNVSNQEAQPTTLRSCGVEIRAGCGLFDEPDIDDPCAEESGICTPGAEGFTCGKKTRLVYNGFRPDLWDRLARSGLLFTRHAGISLLVHLFAGATRANGIERSERRPVKRILGSRVRDKGAPT